jgi:hypothetical protein
MAKIRWTNLPVPGILRVDEHGGGWGGPAQWE